MLFVVREALFVSRCRTDYGLFVKYISRFTRDAAQPFRDEPS